MGCLSKPAASVIVALILVAPALGQTHLQWNPTLEGAKGQASRSGRLVMVYFWSPSCPVCLETEREVLIQPAVAAWVDAAFIPVKVNSDHSPELVRHYGVQRLPAIVVLGPDGRRLDRVEGRMAPQQLSDRLGRLAAHSPSYNHYTPPPHGIQQAPPAVENPPLALDGHCAVSLRDYLLADPPAWVLGNRAHGVIHRGRTYLFADAEKAARFFQAPDDYAPVLSGYDVVLAAEGRAAVGHRAYGVSFGNRIYLFASEATRQRFEHNPNHYADAAVRLTSQPGLSR